MDEDVLVTDIRAVVALPALYARDERTAERVLEFFAARIRNKNTRKAYALAAGSFATWCEGRGIRDFSLVRTLHVAAYIEELSKTVAAPGKAQARSDPDALRLSRHRPGGAS